MITVPNDMALAYCNILGIFSSSNEQLDPQKPWPPIINNREIQGLNPWFGSHVCNSLVMITTVKKFVVSTRFHTKKKRKENDSGNKTCILELCNLFCWDLFGQLLLRYRYSLEYFEHLYHSLSFCYILPILWLFPDIQIKITFNLT